MLHFIIIFIVWRPNTQIWGNLERWYVESFFHKHILQGLQNHIQAHATLLQLGIAKYSPIFVKFR